MAQFPGAAKVDQFEVGSLESKAGPRRIIQAGPDLQIVVDAPTVETWLEVARSANTVPVRASRAKRLFDIAVATTGLAISTPVWAVVLLVAATRRNGPVLYGQKRIGRQGRMFTCWKFRTMRTDADEVLQTMLSTDHRLAEQWNTVQKLDDDPRVTRLGRTLRRFDLDEIPQLINVVVGDMSIVGPRPVVEDEAAKFGPYLPTVLAVRPGLTGAWQVAGRNSMTYDERVRFEANYVETRTFLGDLKICLRTPLALLGHNSGR